MLRVYSLTTRWSFTICGDAEGIAVSLFVNIPGLRIKPVEVLSVVLCCENQCPVLCKWLLQCCVVSVPCVVRVVVSVGALVWGIFAGRQRSEALWWRRHIYLKIYLKIIINMWISEVISAWSIQIYVSSRHANSETKIMNFSWK